MNLFSAESDTPTNILRLTKAISCEDEQGVQQVLLYDAGVGTTPGIVDVITGGLMGVGLDANIVQLYTFLCLNYEEGDEIYLFGFSRGAYTVRSLAGMIRKSGLVRRENIDFVREAYELYRYGGDCETFRELHGSRVPIKALVCFDTVGALGMPQTILGISIPRLFKSAFEFHDTNLNEDIENGIHILSIDENRNAYSPTRMEPSKIRGKTQVTSKFFWGSHSGVGGGKQSEQAASDTTLLFLVSELRRRGCELCFNETMLPDKLPKVDRDFVPVRDSLRTRLIRFITGGGCRQIPSVDMVHWSGVRRFQEVQAYRPGALQLFERELKKLNWTVMKANVEKR